MAGGTMNVQPLLQYMLQSFEMYWIGNPYKNEDDLTSMTNRIKFRIKSYQWSIRVTHEVFKKNNGKKTDHKLS